MKCSFYVPIKNLFVILILLSGSVYGLQKTYSHHDFPPLYNFDNYDACLTSTQNSLPPTYCTVYAEVIPNNSSILWQAMIARFSEFPFRYRRDRLFFGVCVERCKNFANTTAISLKDENDELRNEITDYFGTVHKRPLDLQLRKEYHTLIHACLNYEFHRKYDLNLRTFIEYCERSTAVPGEVEKGDSLQNLFFTIIVVLIMLNILSSLYDLFLKLQQPEDNQANDFYKINPPSKVSQLLTSFSVCRNYYRLIQPSKSDVGKDFQFLDAYRTIAMMFCLYGHTFLAKFQHIANPEYFEITMEDKPQLWLLNTTAVIEIFFVMTGLFLFIKLTQANLIGPQTSWKKLLSIFIQLLVTRYIRFLPSIALLVLFNATVLTHMQDGPFWRHVTEPVRTFSRDSGWRNLLLINNISHKNSAAHHTWYIAADWQLFIFYLFVLMIVAKYPKLKKRIYASLAILAFTIPFGITYWFKLPQTFFIKPESYRYTFFKDMHFYDKVYLPFYANLSGYLVGIFCGELYMKYTSTEEIRKIIRHPKYIIGAHFVFPIAIAIVWLGSLLELTEWSIWTAIYAGIYRFSWNIFVCAVPILGMSCKCGWVTYEFCCLPIFRLLARLTFQVYIWHMTILYMIHGYQRQPYYVNSLYFFTQFVILYTVSNLVAFIAALFMEYPLAQFTQILLTKTNSKHTKKVS